MENQTLIPLIARERIYESRFWKEKCFGLNAETILDRGKRLDCVGFLFGGFNKPTEFFCLVVKLIQIKPSVEIVQAYLDHTESRPTDDLHGQSRDLRYFRALIAVYVRLVASPATVYSLLEPLLKDYRTLFALTPSGTFERMTMDSFVEMLLDESGTPVYGLQLPHLTKRKLLADRGSVEPFVSVLDSDLE
jgi:pre-mRNA-splicing factor 38A